mgnify:FL=1
MAIQDWELVAYQGPATQLVYNLGGDPFKPTEFPDGTIKPFWMSYAVRMYEFRMVYDLLKQYGMLVT